MLTANNYNPDVLSCLANLSNDEVFTPPQVCNQILDLLPAKIWSDQNARFLDPVSKSGVFLREIVKRLMVGLEKQIPPEQKRADHIFQNQIFGIAITELTALAFPPVGVLLQDRQRKILNLRDVQRPTRQYPI